MYFYVYDLERYKETRGLNFDPLAEMPHCAFTKAEPLVDSILHTPYDYEKLTAFRKEFVETDDTNNTQRCVDLIMTFLTEGIMIDKMKSERNFDSIKVSVIVPVYNVEAYLERCLDSLVKQTLEEMEIIVVNDGTKDNSQAIIDRYAAAYPQKVISLIKENGGLSDARNYGIPYAHGEYIGFVDSDDYLNVTMYQKLYDRAAETDSDIVVCGYYGIDENTETRRFFQRGSTLEFGVSLHENPKLLYTNAPYAWNKIYRRALFERTGIRFPKGKIYEDIATIYPLMLHANRISKVNEPLYYYILKREGAITATFSENILQMYDSLAIMNEYYIREGAFEEFKEVLGFINLKHTILRFRDFTAYKDKDLQFKVVHKGFQHLDHYFDDWRRNKAFFDFFFSKNG